MGDYVRRSSRKHKTDEPATTPAPTPAPAPAVEPTPAVPAVEAAPAPVIVQVHDELVKPTETVIFEVNYTPTPVDPAAQTELDRQIASIQHLIDMHPHAKDDGSGRFEFWTETLAGLKAQRPVAAPAPVVAPVVEAPVEVLAPAKVVEVAIPVPTPAPVIPAPVSREEIERQIASLQHTIDANPAAKDDGSGRFEFWTEMLAGLKAKIQ